MNDLNFFINPNARKEKNTTVRILLICIAAMILLVGALFATMTVMNSRISKDIQQIESQLASPQIVEDQKKVDLVNQQLSLLKQYDKSLSLIDAYLSKNDKIKKAFLDKMASAIPANITLTSLTLTQSDLIIEAGSTNDTANAEFVRNLKDSKLFSSVELMSVIKSKTAGAAPNENTITIHAVLEEVMPE